MSIITITRARIHSIILIFLLVTLASCKTAEDIEQLISPSTISGSVGDGPITQAQITLTDNTGVEVGSTLSDSTANYSIDVALGSSYPVLVSARGGTDMVTGTGPDFTLISVAIDSSIETVNINPFSTLIVKTAQSMTGGLTAANLTLATDIIVNNFNFGLDPALVANPITAKIDGTNVAAIVKASEIVGEVVRRTRDTLLTVGNDLSGDDIITAVAGDLTDGLLDGIGMNADALVAATANVVTAQVLVEALPNRLNTGGADATMLMDTAISVSMPGATMTTDDVLITEDVITQARIAVAAAQAFNADANFAIVGAMLAGLSGQSLAADVQQVIPADANQYFNEILSQVPLAQADQWELINASVRAGNTGSTAGGEQSIAEPPSTAIIYPNIAPGTFEFSVSGYSVGEGDGTVAITINRIDGNDGEVSVSWKTQGVTATFSDDYGNFDWTPLTFAPGETSKVERISIVSDTAVEGDETFNVLLGNSTNGASLGTITTAVVTIIDDDTAPAPTPEPAPAPAPEPAPAPAPEPAPAPAPEPAPAPAPEPAPAPAPAPTPTVTTADYYVAPTGSDSSNPGTVDLPFASVAKAISVARSGDLIYVRGGRYTLSSSVVISSKNGSSGNMIKLFAYPGETPILDGARLTGSGPVLDIVSSSYWHIKGLEIANSPSHGVYLRGNSSYNTIEALNIHGSGRLNTTGSGLHIGGRASYNLILNVDSHHNKDTTLGNADGFAIKSADAVGNVFRGSRAWRNSDDGWDTWNGAPVIIEYCSAWSNGLDDNNNPLGDGNGFKLGQGNGGHVLRYNKAWNNRRRGFDYNSGAASTIYNNTAYNNPVNFVFLKSAHVLRNNISYQGSVQLDANVNDQSNTWNLGITNPQFRSTDPQSADFLKPSSTSPVIDAGTNVGLPYKGTAPDLGADEQ